MIAKIVVCSMYKKKNDTAMNAWYFCSVLSGDKWMMGTITFVILFFFVMLFPGSLLQPSCVTARMLPCRHPCITFSNCADFEREVLFTGEKMQNNEIIIKKKE